MEDDEEEEPRRGRANTGSIAQEPPNNKSTTHT
jgi:hypothetical protein